MSFAGVSGFYEPRPDTVHAATIEMNRRALQHAYFERFMIYPVLFISITTSPSPGTFCLSGV
jgi:hypothetical protein